MSIRQNGVYTNSLNFNNGHFELPKLFFFSSLENGKRHISPLEH